MVSNELTKVGTEAGKKMLAAIGVDFPEKALGLQYKFVYRQYSREQEKGYWLLLGLWAKAFNEPGVTNEDFHQYVCQQVFGEFLVTTPDGYTKERPIRTTTTRWDAAEQRYIRDKLKDDQYSILIEQTYRIAAEGGVILPELEREEG